MNLCSIEMLANEYCCNLNKEEFIALLNRSTNDNGFLAVTYNSVKENDD